MSKKVKRPRSKSAQQGMSKKTQAVLLVVGVLGGTLLIAGLIMSPWNISAIRHEAFRGKAGQFLAMPTATETEPGAYLTGKAVVIDLGDQRLDPIHTRLPDEIRAYSVDEVGTVIWLEWDFEAVKGGQWGGTTGHFSTCKVTVIDRERNVIVGQQTVMGASSRVTTGAGRGAFRAPPGVMTATRCNEQVLGYIKGLPRQ